MTISGSEWCDTELGFSYAYIQTHYWGVGLFAYWQRAQLPNFLLAAPMFLLVGTILLLWVRDQYKRFHESQSTRRNISHLLNFQLGGYAHLGVLAALALCTMHVQVVTRFLVANCPYLFLYCAKLEKPISRVVVCYFVVYSVVGTVVHSTFYPWT